MFNVRLAGDHLNGKLLFTWLSPVLSMMVSFCAVLFPRDVLDEILNLIESVSEVFLPTRFKLSATFSSSSSFSSSPSAVYGCKKEFSVLVKAAENFVWYERKDISMTREAMQHFILGIFCKPSMTLLISQCQI